MPEYHSIGAGGANALRDLLAQREMQRQQELLEQFKMQEMAQRQREFQETLEARREAQKNLEVEREYRRASNLHQNMQEGLVSPETQQLMAKHGLDVGVLESKPGIRLGITTGTSGLNLPEAQTGVGPGGSFAGRPSQPMTRPDPAQTTMSDPTLGTEGLYQSRGGSKFQEQQRAAQDKYELLQAQRQATADRTDQDRIARAENAEAQRRAAQDMLDQRLDTQRLIASGQQGTAMAIAGMNASIRGQAAADKRAVADEQREAAQTLTEDTLTAIRKLKTHKGLPLAQGVVSSRTTSYLPDAQDYLAERDRIIAGLTLPNMGALKGPSSDKDVMFVKQAGTKLATDTLSAAETRAELNRLEAFLEQKLGLPPGGALPPRGVRLTRPPGGDDDPTAGMVIRAKPGGR